MPPTRDIEVFPTAADLFHAAAEEFSRVGRAGHRGSGTVRGRALWRAPLQKVSIPCWPPATPTSPGRAPFFFGDERHVPPTDAESNYRMVHESLFSKVAIPAQNIFRVQAENPDAVAPPPTTKPS